MKKKLMMIIGLMCIIMPCMILFTACLDDDGGRPEKYYVSLGTNEWYRYIDMDLSKTMAEEGDTITIDYEVDAGYELDYFTVNGVEISGNTFEMPNEDVEILAYVKKKHYTVNIRLNNVAYGTLMVTNSDNTQYYYGKSDYEYGDTLTVQVTPNAGYYLKNYSDNNQMILTRQIQITGNVNIDVILAEGEACSYYGYNIVMHGESEYNLYNTVGNRKEYVKNYPHKSYNDGYMEFEIHNSDLFSYFEVNYRGTHKLIFDDKLNKEQCDALFTNYNGSWIDIYERDTRLGTIYSTYTPSYSLDDSIIDAGRLDMAIFDGHNPAWLYENTSGTIQKSNNLVFGGTNTYVFDVEDMDNDGTINIYEYIVFSVGDELFYAKNSDATIYDEESAFTHTSVDFDSVVDEVRYTLTFRYAK